MPQARAPLPLRGGTSIAPGPPVNFRRGLRAAAGVGLGLWLGLAWVIDRVGADASAPWPSAGPEVLVVLGARVEADGTPSPTLRSRVEHAAAVWRGRPGAFVLFSGGVGTHGASEASVARDLALSLGVPAGQCLVEEASHSTAQNAFFSARLLRARFPRGVHVTVVSDPYHLLRARLLFQRASGAEVSISPVLDAPRHRDGLSRVGWALREVPALLKDAVTTTAE